MMKNIVIATDGTKKASTKKSADCTYVQYDSDTLMVHFSEVSEVTKDQLKAIGDVVEKACKGKLVARVKQRSANVVGFSLKKESDIATADSSMQTACNELVDEAKKANAKLKGNNNSSSNNNSGNGNSNSSGGNGNSDSSGGNGNSNSSGGNGSGNSFDKTKDIFGRDLKQSYPGLFWPGMSQAEEQAAYDSYWNMVSHVDKDIFGRR